MREQSRTEEVGDVRLGWKENWWVKQRKQKLLKFTRQDLVIHKGVVDNFQFEEDRLKTLLLQDKGRQNFINGRT